MEMSSVRWNSELQVREDCNFSSLDHLEMDPLHFETLDDLTDQYFLSLPLEGSLGTSLSQDSYNASFLDQELISNNPIEICDNVERPAKQMKTSTWTSSIPTAPKVMSSSGHLISFGNVSSQTSDDHEGSFEDLNPKYLDSTDIAVGGGQGTKKSNNSSAVAKPPYAQDHVIAERKRRERLTEHFIALSAIVPGLKKLDKASVLGDAIKYVKRLQERVDLLEEEVKKKKPEDSSAMSQNSTKEAPAVSPDDSSSGDENSGRSNSNKRVAEIEGRVSEKNMLIRIHCEKQKGFIPKMLSEIEKLNLSVISSSVLPFGDYAMDITIVSQMEPEFSSTVEGVVRKLRSALQQFP